MARRVSDSRREREVDDIASCSGGALGSGRVGGSMTMTMTMRMKTKNRWAVGWSSDE
jgi:hypothetical protein